MVKLALLVSALAVVLTTATRPPEILFKAEDGSACTIVKEGKVVTSKDCQLHGTDPSLTERVTTVEIQVNDLVERVGKLETAGPATAVSSKCESGMHEDNDGTCVNGCSATSDPPCKTVFNTKDELDHAMRLQCSDAAAAKAKYGDVATEWGISKITDLSHILSMYPRGQRTDDQGKNFWNYRATQCTDESMVACTPFKNCNPDIGRWDTSSVTDMNELARSNEGFNTDLSNWNVSSVTEMHCPFCDSPFEGSIQKWELSSMQQVEKDKCHMFYNNPHFESNPSLWDQVVHPSSHGGGGKCM